MGIAIIGCGNALPALDVVNDELTALVDTSDEWIAKRTGIKSRKIATTETTIDLGVAASRKAMGWDAGGYNEHRVNPEDIDLVICATVTPDTMVPTNAAIIRRRMGLENAACFDLNAACSGFVYALTVAEGLLASSLNTTKRTGFRRALVVAAERTSRITNWADRNTCVLLGDGSGAVVVEYDPDRTGIMSTFIANEDDIHNALTLPDHNAVVPPYDDHGVNLDAPNHVDPSHASIDEELGIAEAVAEGAPRDVLRMNGQQVFKFSAHAMKLAIEEVCKRAEVDVQDMKLVVPHQANQRIIDFAAKRMGVSNEIFKMSIRRRGNSSAASVPSALADAYAEGDIQPGDKVILVAFGGGYTLGAVLYEA